MRELITYYKRTWLAMSFITVFTFSYGQTDSLLNELKLAKHDTDKIQLMLKIARQKLYVNTDEAQDYTKKALALAENKNYKNKKDDAYDMLGIVFTIKGEYKLALENYSIAVKINKELGNQIGLAKTYGNISALYQYEGNFEKAMKAQTKSLKISEHLGNKLETATSLLNLGNLNSILKNYNRAEDNYRQAIKLKKELHLTNQPEMAILYNDLAIVLYQQGYKDSAINYVEQSLKISKSINSYLTIAESMNILGEIHYKSGEFEAAKKDFLQALPIIEQSGYGFELTTTYLFLAEDYAALNQIDSATYYFRKILNSKIVDDRHLLDVYIGFTKLFIKIHQQDSALFYFEKMTFLKDKTLNAEKMKIIEQTQTEYETEKLNREKAEAKEHIIAVEKSRLWLLIICSFSLGGIALLLLYMRQRKIREQKNKIELEQKALRSQMNPHFIFNSLNAIQDMYVAGETNLANDYMGDFSELMRKILDNSGKNTISIKEEIDTLRLYLQMEKLRSGNLLTYEIEVNENIDQFNTFMPPLVIQPFVENAVWHGILPKKEKGKVSVQLKIRNKKLVCTVEDNGIGYKESIKNKNTIKHESKGIKLTEQRLGAVVKIEELNPGTRITLIIPI